MINEHLHILHLFANTVDDKVNTVARKRYENLCNELETQQINEFSIIEGFYDPKKTRQAIHQGHRRIVELAKWHGIPNVIIAEDDIAFTHPNSYKYFLSQIPESYDIFAGLYYAAEMDGNRVLNGASGMCTLYSVHERFYDFFLSMDITNHVDRELGLTAYKHEYYVCQPMCVRQRGGYSHQLKKEMFYDVYLEDKSLYNG